MTYAVALAAAQGYRDAARAALAERLAARAIDDEQRAAHGFAWIATSVAALEAVHAWADRGGGANPVDRIVAELAAVEILAQLAGGLPMGQNEIFRPEDLGLEQAAQGLRAAIGRVQRDDPRVLRARLVEHLTQDLWPTETFHDPELDAVRDQFRRFTDDRIIPHAHGWHLAKRLDPRCHRRADGGAWHVRGFVSLRNSAAWAWASWSCASSQRNCRAAGSAQVRSAPDRKSRAT